VGNAILSLIGCVLNAMAFWWGYNLWQNPFFAAEASPHEVDEAVVTVLQPNAEWVETREERVVTEEGSMSGSQLGLLGDGITIDKDQVQMVQI